MVRFPEEIEPRHAYLSRVSRNAADPEAEIIDEAIFLFMEGPHSYTGEDVLEIQAHGSNTGLKNILQAVLDSEVEGVRMAEPGEFTKLAFLNGKMDLSQAEAVIDIIKAKTDLSLSIAESQSAGRLGDKIREIRETMLDVLAQMAVDIDYPDEDEDFAGDYDGTALVSQLRWVLNDIEDLLDTASIGRIAREGVRVVIAGKPNAGKSSLMNALLGEGRVIVTDVPGTTRDTVEESVSIGGVPIVLVDTAGLRDTEDKVEKIGIERTAQAMASADLIILVLDGSHDLDDKDDTVLEYIEKMNNEHLLVVINKNDLGVTITEEDVKAKLPGASVVSTSLVGGGVPEAVKAVADAVTEMYDLGRLNAKEMNIVTNERHVRMLRNAEMNINEAITMIQNGDPMEVIELSAHYAYDSLGNIIGEEVGDEVLDRVFSKFCLGK
jgi:tRNA modification GTPase